MRGYWNLGKGEIDGFSRNLLLLQNARIREKEDVSIQVEDVAWQVDRSVAGVENGRVERHHGVESAHKERETREGRLGSILYFASFFFAAIRSDQLSE